VRGRLRRAVLLALGALAAAVFPACGREEAALSPAVQGGDVGRGRAAIERHGCGGCHVIPGIRSARGTVGPALTDFAQRPYIAGVLVHDTLNLLRWLQDPPTLAPGTVMPRLGVSEGEARDIAAYLYRDRPAAADAARGAAPSAKAPDA
jgi:cytochrome c2